MRSVEAKQEEHRAILLGDGLEGRGGLRNDLWTFKQAMEKRFSRQNLILYGLTVTAAIAVPTHVKDLVSVIAKLLAAP